jgi:hemerythrin-like domain-containing protein
MKATETLMEEHRVIERVLGALEIGVQRLEAKQLRPGFFVDAAEFIKGFADGCHHKKEEGVLFPAMLAHGVRDQGGPIGVMMAEHNQGRTFTAAMRKAAQDLEAGDESARAVITQNAQGYITLLRQHITKEDTVLFPMADRVVPAISQDKIAENFERIEHEETGAGVHEEISGACGSTRKRSEGVGRCKQPVD